jgi:molecular chaperone DnaJ
VTHYERLGVKPSASVEEIRRAYRNLARVHHPDTAGSISGVDMAAVNEAWRVLSDPARRAVYDASLRSGRRPNGVPAAPVSPADADLDDDTGFVPIRHPLARLGIPLPWIVVLGTLAVIFVFTAYAVRSSGGSSKPDGVIEVGSCVTVAPDGVAETACDSAHDGRVVAVPPSGTLCDASVTGVLDRRTGNVVCVRRG